MTGKKRKAGSAIPSASGTKEPKASSKTKKSTYLDQFKEVFDDIRTAAVRGQLALVECTNKRGNRVAVLAIMHPGSDGSVNVQPVGKLVKNAMDEYTPPPGASTQEIPT